MTAEPDPQPDSTLVLSPGLPAPRIYTAPVTRLLGEKPLEPGTHLDRYLILENLGGGGTGQVYRARDTELDREVALKVLGRAQCRQPEALNRFRAEAQVQARLRSPHVITLYSLLELPFAAVLVLEYVEGETLENRLRRTGPLTAEEAIGVFDQALLGLCHVHEMGVIHRDIKPSNLFITSAGQVKVMDFSVAKLTARDAYPPRTMVGTLLYIAPEQISGRDTDVRSDVYALGMTLYEAVTGRLPFQGQTDYALMHAHVQKEPPRPRDFAPTLPLALERVILKAVEKDPGRRYRSAEEFRAALVKLASPAQRRGALLPANAYGPARPVRSSRLGRRIFASLALDLLLVTAICGMFYALVLYPVQPPSVQAPLAAAAPAQPAAVDSAPAPAQPVRVRARPSVQRPTDVGKDPYKSLRQAWGD